MSGLIAIDCPDVFSNWSPGIFVAAYAAGAVTLSQSSLSDRLCIEFARLLSRFAFAGLQVIFR